MNITLKDAAEVYLNESKPREDLGMFSFCDEFSVSHSKSSLGEILLKGDNITLVQPLKK